MLLRKLLLAAALMAPLATVPVAASAQATGRVVATAHTPSAAGWQNGKATGRPTDLPPGIAKGAGGETPPPGIAGTRPPAEPQSEEQPPAEQCGTEFTFQNGTYGVLDTCTGVFTPL